MFLISRVGRNYRRRLHGRSQSGEVVVVVVALRDVPVFAAGSGVSSLPGQLDRRGNPSAVFGDRRRVFAVERRRRLLATEADKVGSLSGESVPVMKYF